MEEIARRAEFSVGTLYNFFKSKEDLYAEILREKASVMEEHLRRGISEVPTPKDKIERYFYARIDLFWAYPQFFRLFFQETRSMLRNPRYRLAPEVLQRYNDFLSYVETIFDEGISCGQFRTISANTLTLCLEGIIQAYLDRLSDSDSKQRDREEERKIFAVFERGAMTGG